MEPCNTTVKPNVVGCCIEYDRNDISDAVFVVSSGLELFCLTSIDNPQIAGEEIGIGRHI